MLQGLQTPHFVYWTWNSWTRSNLNLPMTNPESGISPAESTDSLVHYSSRAPTSDENHSFKNIEVGTVTESFPQGAVSSSSQKVQPQGTVLPGTFLHYNITRFWNAHLSRVLTPGAAYIVKKILHISLWQNAVPENFRPFLCSTKPSEIIWWFEDILEKSFSSIIAVVLESEEVNLS